MLVREDQSVRRRVSQGAAVLAPSVFAFKPQRRRQHRRAFLTVMENRAASALPPDVELQASCHHEAQQVEERNEVGLAGAVRADEHGQIAHRHVDLADRSET